MAQNNVNNNQVGNDPDIIYPGPSPTTMFFNLIRNTAHLILRFYLTVLLIIYHWGRKMVLKATQPFEPVIEQVRKVPKKDISAEGIFYQFLRLQFLIILYVSPFFVNAAVYLTQPVVWVKNWMEAYVNDEDNSWKRSDPTVLREG